MRTQLPTIAGRAQRRSDRANKWSDDRLISWSADWSVSRLVSCGSVRRCQSHFNASTDILTDTDDDEAGENAAAISCVNFEVCVHVNWNFQWPLWVVCLAKIAQNQNWQHKVAINVCRGQVCKWYFFAFCFCFCCCLSVNVNSWLLGIFAISTCIATGMSTGIGMLFGVLCIRGFWLFHCLMDLGQFGSRCSGNNYRCRMWLLVV